MTTPDLPGFADVLDAAGRLQGVIRRTPLINDPRLDAEVGGRLFLKPECLQLHGSFKIRGAYNRLATFRPEERARGVLAMSSGNHAIAVAAAAKRLGCPATIVMPADAPQAKRADAGALGAEIITYDRQTEDRDVVARRIAEARGLVVAGPFDDPMVVAGQGTAGLEIAEDLAAAGLVPDVVLVCASGGGLAAGAALGVQERFPQAAVYPVEPEGHDDLARSLAAGSLQSNAPGVRSICDALLIPQAGEIPFAIGRTRWAGVLTVDDDAVRDAMRAAFRLLRLVVEPGGAVALAAALSGRIDLRGKTAVAILSGGNVDAEAFAAILAPGGEAG